MRPQYETAADRLVEGEVESLLLSRHRLRCYKLPISYRVDWIVYDNHGSLHGFIELKGRKVSRNRYPTLILSLAKFASGCDLARVTRSHFWVGAKWVDGLGFFRADGCDVEVKMGGRTDRGDSADIEPVVHLPIKEFQDAPL